MKLTKGSDNTKTAFPDITPSKTHKNGIDAVSAFVAEIRRTCEIAGNAIAEDTDTGDRALTFPPQFHLPDVFTVTQTIARGSVGAAVGSPCRCANLGLHNRTSHVVARPAPSPAAPQGLLPIPSHMH